MPERAVDIEGILEAILRGAAKIVGCMSANLVVVNRETEEVHIRIGTSSDKAGELIRVESAFGASLQSMVFRLADVADSMVAGAWRDRTLSQLPSG